MHFYLDRRKNCLIRRSTQRDVSSLHKYMGDSTNTAKIESIFLQVIFSEIFLMEFVVGIYLKVCTWLCPQKTPPRGQEEAI